MKLEGPQFILSATDLTNFLACKHLSELNRQVALGQLKKPYRNDPALEVLEKRGREHEQAYVKYLSDKKLSVINLHGKPLSATLEAMKAGHDVIVQARLEEKNWMGYADILLKVPLASELGDWSYEVQDTKLSTNTKGATILQLSLYSRMVEILQGMLPAQMHVVKPGNPFDVESYQCDSFKSYFALAQKHFQETIENPPAQTYPDEVEHCGICRWWKVCDKQRHDDDHLSLVAGMRNLHIEELKRQSIHTLESFANVPVINKPERGNLESFVRRQLQARIQLDGRIQQQLIYKSLYIETGRGLNRLPEPSPGDIYFDIEGDPFFEKGGLEYLLGYAFKNGNELQYEKLWAVSRTQEKLAFEKFMTFVTDRLKKYPKLHIYHFAPYEPSAVKRLARVHAIFEKEVDELLRAEKFIDLHAVFKESLLASVERYSLKDLEKFTTYTRQVELADASHARKTVECALELNDFQSVSSETVNIIEKYNEDDCLATEALHQWLEKIRADQTLQGATLQRPEEKAPEANEKIQQLEIRSQAIYKSLVKSLPEDRTTWTQEHHTKWLLAHQIEYFRREDKSAWWEFYRVHELEHDDLLNERKAITGLTFVEALPLKPREKTPVHRYIFPPQEVSIDEGDEVIEVKGDKIGTVSRISLAEYTIDIKKTAKTIDKHPIAIHVSERIDPGTLATSLMNLAESIDEDGFGHQWPYHASKDLLMKRNPILINNQTVDALVNETQVDTATRLALSLDRSVLAIQGPPGTGKTYTGAKIILALLKKEKRVGVTAISHSVIRTLFEKVHSLGEIDNQVVKFAHKVSVKNENCPDWITEYTESAKAIQSLDEGKLLGGTAWLWSDDKARETLDYLIVDEAGQMSLSQVLAASRAAKNLILLGDPQQLEQPQKGAHPEGSDVAALTYLLDGNPTMPEGRGIFLDTTRRIHPAIAQFTSEQFYEGRLHSMPGLEKQQISGGTKFDGAGLYYVPVQHRGNQNKAPEEIIVIKKIVDHFLLEKGNFTDNNGTRKLQKNDLLVVAPYNAQVSALIEALPGISCGTVDKFQGKEAPIVIYSMTSSTIQDAPRGVGFLFNPNRLNVATSRAKSTCVLVMSEDLVNTECRTIEQMKYINAVCRYMELAQTIQIVN